jgi:hypothetical protein
MASQEARRHALLEDRELGIAGRVEHRQLQLLRKALGDVALRDQAERHQQDADLLATFLLQAQRPLQRGRIQLSALDQQLAQALARHRRGGRRFLRQCKSIQVRYFIMRVSQSAEKSFWLNGLQQAFKAAYGPALQSSGDAALRRVR